MKQNDSLVTQSLLLLVLIYFSMYFMIYSRVGFGPKPIIACTTDYDCAQKNPGICGGPYEPECK